MLTSIYVFDIYKGIANVDPSRIAAGVITVISFLGAGTIIHESEGVRGAYYSSKFSRSCFILIKTFRDAYFLRRKRKAQSKLISLA